MANYLEESALFVYKNDKFHAFSIINKIAKINNKSPLTIDLSKSSWFKLNYYKLTLLDLLKDNANKKKIFMSIFFMFSFLFNSRIAQI